MSYKVVAKVYETKNYDNFVPFIGNRGTRPSHLRVLMNSIEEHGWINSLPMTVKKNGQAGKLQVIDGHTRYYAAKELERPVKFVIVEGEVDNEDIYIINRSQRGWGSADYVESYARQGRGNFVILREFMQEFSIGVTTAGTLLAGTSNDLNAKIATATFEVEDEEWARQVVMYLIRMNPAVEFSVMKNKFVLSFMRAMLVPEFDPERFIHQVTHYPERVKDYANVTDIAAMFEDLYNFNKMKKNQIPLAFHMEQLRK